MMERFFVTFTCLIIFLTGNVESINDTVVAEYRLYNAIFGSYNPLLRPRSNCAEPVDVEVEYELNSVVGLMLEFELLDLEALDYRIVSQQINDTMTDGDPTYNEEVNEIMHTIGFVVAIWYDEFLKWNPTDYENIKHLVIPAESVWLPDLGIKNSAIAFTDKKYRENFRVDIMYDGRIIWKFGGTFSTYCTLDMTYYPFDLQKCDIDVENWSYTQDSVDLTKLTDEVHLQEFSENGQWRLDHTSAADQTFTEDTHPGKLYPRVKFSIFLARKFQYYIINIILPALFVISISLMVFWLPPDSGEKVSLGVTVLLSFSVFQLVIMEHTPRTSDYTPVMNTLFTIIMGEATFSVLISICVLYYHHHGPESRPPKLIRFVAFKVLAKILCMSQQMPPDNQVNPDENLNKNKTPFFEKIPHPELHGSHADVKTILEHKSNSVIEDTASYFQRILYHIQRFQKGMDEKVKQDDVTHEWKCVARVIERAFFWFSFIVTLIIIPVLLFSRDTGH